MNTRSFAVWICVACSGSSEVPPDGVGPTDTVQSYYTTPVGDPLPEGLGTACVADEDCPEGLICVLDDASPATNDENTCQLPCAAPAVVRRPEHLSDPVRSASVERLPGDVRRMPRVRGRRRAALLRECGMRVGSG